MFSVLLFRQNIVVIIDNTCSYSFGDIPGVPKIHSLKITGSLTMRLYRYIKICSS